jgi:NADH-quinone oxidoreductase subunit H
VIQQEGASRTVIVAFAVGLVLVATAVSSLFERSKKKSEELLPEGEAPDFPIPSLPGVSSFNASTQSGDKSE